MWKRGEFPSQKLGHRYNETQQGDGFNNYVETQCMALKIILGIDENNLTWDKIMQVISILAISNAKCFFKIPPTQSEHQKVFTFQQSYVGSAIPCT